jgi:hypothetical protein
MASMKVGRGLLCVVAALGLPALGLPALVAGCGGDSPPIRPDAFMGVDAGAADAFSSGVDAFVPPGTDAGRDGGGGMRMCRSPMGNCDLLAQDCMAGMTCVYALPEMGATEPQTVCAPIVGAGAEEGGACCALNSCDTGLVCVGAVESAPGTCSSMGTCRRYCCGSSTDCAAGEVCSGFGSGFMGGICDTIDGCDLVDQTGCESMSGTGCYPGSGGATQCVRPTAAMAAEGATCEFTNDCVPGTACFTVTPGGGGMARSICLRFCDIGDGAADCPASGGMACQAAGDLPTGTGVCPPPA